MANPVGASSTEQFINDALADWMTLTPGDGCHVVVPALGTTALLRYRLDGQEDERRRQAHLGAITQPEVLDLLLGLPVGAAVPISCLTSSELSALRAAPAGAITAARGSVIRHAVRPLVVDLAVVLARRWRTGLELAGRFAPFCARMMLLDRWPSDAEDLWAQADFYGIGVMVTSSGDADVWVAPQSFQYRRFTAAGWQFVEEVYRHVR